MGNIHCWTEGSAGASAVMPSQRLGRERQEGGGRAGGERRRGRERRRKRGEGLSERESERKRRESGRGREGRGEERKKREREMGDGGEEKRRDTEPARASERPSKSSVVKSDYCQGPEFRSSKPMWWLSSGKGPSALQHLRAPPRRLLAVHIYRKHIFGFVFFESGFLCVVLAALKLTLYFRLASKLAI